MLAVLLKHDPQWEHLLLQTVELRRDGQPELVYPCHWILIFMSLSDKSRSPYLFAYNLGLFALGLQILSPTQLWGSGGNIFFTTFRGCSERETTMLVVG